jgi:hypothetical protein
MPALRSGVQVDIGHGEIATSAASAALDGESAASQWWHSVTLPPCAALIFFEVLYKLYTRLDLIDEYLIVCNVLRLC